MQKTIDNLFAQGLFKINDQPVALKCSIGFVEQACVYDNPDAVIEFQNYHGFSKLLENELNAYCAILGARRIFEQILTNFDGNIFLYFLAESKNLDWIRFVFDNYLFDKTKIMSLIFILSTKNRLDVLENLYSTETFIQNTEYLDCVLLIEPENISEEVLKFYLRFSDASKIMDGILSILEDTPEKEDNFINMVKFLCKSLQNRSKLDFQKKADQLSLYKIKNLILH